MYLFLQKLIFRLLQLQMKDVIRYNNVISYRWKSKHNKLLEKKPEYAVMLRCKFKVITPVPLPY